MTLSQKLTTIQKEVQDILNNTDNPFRVSINKTGYLEGLPMAYIQLNIAESRFINEHGYAEDYLSSNWFEEDLYENLCCCRQDDIEVSIHTLFDNEDEGITPEQIIFIS